MRLNFAIVLGIFLLTFQGKMMANLPIPIEERPIIYLAPDLVVMNILEPEYISSTGQSRIRAVVKNIGTATSNRCYGNIKDDGRIVYVTIPVLAPGASSVMIFYLPYWVYNPDANFTVYVDSTKIIPELREGNNSKTFFNLG